MNELEQKRLTKKQKIALLYLKKGATPRKAAQKSGKKLQTIERWMTEDGPFRNKLEKGLKEIDDKDAQYRRRNMTRLLDKTYDELRKRFGERKVFEELETKEIVQMAKVMAGEIRADTPKVITGEGGQTFNINILMADVAERAKVATSAQMVIDTKKIEQGGTVNADG